MAFCRGRPLSGWVTVKSMRDCSTLRCASTRGPRSHGGFCSERCVHDLFEPAQCSDSSLVIKRQELHENYGGNTAARINPEVGVVDPGPAQAAGSSHTCITLVWL